MKWFKYINLDKAKYVNLLSVILFKFKLNIMFENKLVLIFLLLFIMNDNVFIYYL